MASQEKLENTTELMRILYEDSDVKIAASNPDKFILNLLKCDDIGTVREIHVIKKWDQFSNLNSCSSAERKLSDYSREDKGVMAPIITGATVNLTNENITRKPRATQQTIEIEEYVQLNANLSCNIHRWPPIPSNNDEQLTSDAKQSIQQTIEIEEYVHLNANLSSNVHSWPPIPSNNAGQPSSDTAQHTSDSERQTAKIEQRTSTSDAKQRTSDSKQRNANIEQRASDAKQRTSETAQRTSDRGQRPSDAKQRTSDSGQRSSDLAQRTSDSGQRPSDAKQRTSDSGQRSSDLAQRTSDSGQRPSDTKQRTSETAQRTSEAKQCSSDVNQRTSDTAQRTSDTAQRTSDSGPRSSDAKQRTSDSEQRPSDAKQRTSETAQRTSEAKQRSSDVNQRTSDTAQRTSDSGQRSSDAKQRTSDSGQRPSDAKQRTSETAQRTSEAKQRPSDVNQRTSDTAQRTSDIGQRTTSKQSVDSKKSKSRVKLDSVPSEATMVATSSASTTAGQSAPKSQLSFKKSKSATELSTPSKAVGKACTMEADQQTGQKINCECTENAQEPRASAEEDSAASGPRAKGAKGAKGKATAKRKRVHARRQYRQVRYQSSSESDRGKMAPKRRRRNQGNRSKVTKMVVHEAKRQIKVARKPKWGGAVLLQWETSSNSAAGVSTDNGLAVSSATVNRITARLGDANNVQPTKSMSNGQITVEVSSSVVAQGSIEILEHGMDHKGKTVESKASGSLSAKSKYSSSDEQVKAAESKASQSTYSSRDEQGTAAESKASGSLSAKSKYSSRDDQGKVAESKPSCLLSSPSKCYSSDEQGKAAESNVSGLLSAKSKHSSRDEQEKAAESKASCLSSAQRKYSSRDGQGKAAESKPSGLLSAQSKYSSSDEQETSSSTDIASHKAEVARGSTSATKISKESWPSSITPEYHKPYVDTEDDFVVVNERESSHQSFSESQPKETGVWLSKPSRSYTSKAEFIHNDSDSEDDTEVVELEKADEHQEVAETTATYSDEDDFSDKASGHRQPSAYSFPKTSFASVMDSGSGKVFSSVISSPSSTDLSETNTRSLTTEHCHYYDAFNETFYDANIQQVQLLMDNLSKTGFLVSAQSDSEGPESSSKNALTATWRNAMHRPKWDETVDLCLICGNQEFYVHRLVVVHFSRKLYSLLCKHVLKPGLAVEVLGINPMALHTIIDWMYTLEIDIRRNNVLDVFMAAICLDVKKLQVKCINLMYEIINEFRIDEGHYTETKPSTELVDSVSRTRTNSGLSRQHSTLDESDDGETTGSAQTMRTGTWKKGKTSNTRSTASWTPKQSTSRIAFQAKNGQDVSNASLGKHCLVEKKVSLSKGSQESHLKSPSRNSAWSHHDEFNPEYETYEDLYGNVETAAEENDAMSEASYVLSDKMPQPCSDESSPISSSSRTSSVSVYTSYSTYGGSQKSLSDRFSPRHPSETPADGYLSKNSSSFTFEDRPVPPIPSCKKITMRTDQTQHERNQTGTTEVVTIKKAQTTRIVNFQKIESTAQCAVASHDVIGELLMDAALSHEVSVVAPVQINKPAKLMQTYTLAMPRSFTSDRVLLFGGLSRADKTDIDEAANTVHCYDVSSGKYDRLGKLPTPLFDAAACYYEDGIYLAGGITLNSVTATCPGKATTDVWFLDLVNPVWQRCKSMQHPRAGHCLVTLGDKIYAIGGSEDSEGSRVTATVESYWPEEDIWTSVHSLPAPFWRMGAVSFNGAIWLCGGMTDPIQVKTNEIFIYSPRRDQWFRHEPSLLKKVAMAALVNVQGELVLVGGLSGNREKDSLDGCALDHVDVFSNESQRWHTIANMSDPRFLPSAVTLGDKIVIIGGRNSRFSPPLKSVEIYSKTDNQWMTCVKALPLPLSNSAAVALPRATIDFS